MSGEPPPLAAAGARLKGRPGRPRRDMAAKPTRAHQAAADAAPLQPRLLDVAGAAAFLNCSVWTVRDLIAAGVLARVVIPAGNGRDLRRVLLDREQLDELVVRWREAAR